MVEKKVMSNVGKNVVAELSSMPDNGWQLKIYAIILLIFF